MGKAKAEEEMGGGGFYLYDPDHYTDHTRWE